LVKIFVHSTAALAASRCTNAALSGRCQFFAPPELVLGLALCEEQQNAMLPTPFQQTCGTSATVKIGDLSGENEKTEVFGLHFTIHFVPYF
jgi:hypothetical protein